MSDANVIDEPGKAAPVAHDLWRQDLQCDRAAQNSIAGMIDLALPALTDQRLDLVLPERRIGQIGTIHGSNILDTFDTGAAWCLLPAELRLRGAALDSERRRFPFPKGGRP